MNMKSDNFAIVSFQMLKLPQVIAFFACAAIYVYHFVVLVYSL